MKLLFLLSLFYSTFAKNSVLVTFHDNTLVTTEYKHRFVIGDLVIYNFDMDYSPMEWNGNVQYMEPDHDIHLSSDDTIWNLDRISHRRSSSKNYKYVTNFYGKNSTVYIIDTGIDVEHTEFEGRAFHGFDSTGDSSCLNLHGTHVAGTVGSKSYGVAKSSTLIDVRVLNCKGSGSYSGVIAGIEWVAKQKKGVSNMSLGGPKSSIVNKALAKLSELGHYVVVAAGNESQDACDVSPASEPSVFTVGATKEGDYFAYFSNWGKCVDILAPGVKIKSTIPGGGTKLLQGTSMASPHVAGVIALRLEEYGFLDLDVMKKLLFGHSTKDHIKGLKSHTVNNLLYSRY